MADKASLSYGNLAVGHASRTNHEQLAWFPPLAQSMADNDKLSILSYPPHPTPGHPTPHTSRLC
ncbi:MAG: hypothetical protein F6K55_46430 [Moorea sp. SIO4A3]|nr:hypothetical protein [Moorena sp. SIO4A3]